MRGTLFALLGLVLQPWPARAEPVVVEAQPVGRTNALRALEPNGARHVARDRLGRVHLVFTDGADVFYRMGEAGPDGRVAFAPAEQLSDGSSRVLVLEHAGMPAARGAVMALHEGEGGVAVDVAWVTEARDVVTRRVEPDGGLLGPIVDTGVDGQLPVLVADGSGRLHLLAEHAFVEPGDLSEIRYGTSADGLAWDTDVVESADETGSRNARLPCAAVDRRGDLHVVYQAEGFEGDGGAVGATWWSARHLVRSDGGFEAQTGPLEAFPEWGPPPAGRALLFAYCALEVDDHGGLLLAWHGTARSGAYGLDDAFLSTAPYDEAADTFAPWTRPLALHRAVHDGVPGGPVEAGGDDELLTWVPSLAPDPATGELFVLLMLGAFDDEIGPADTSTATEAGIVSVLDGVLRLGLVNLSESPAERNWYPNAAPRVFCDEARGVRSLDVLWVAGVQDPADPWARGYEVVHALLDLGDAPPGCATASPDGGPSDGGHAGDGSAEAGPVDDGGLSDGGSSDAGPTAGRSSGGGSGCSGCAACGPAPRLSAFAALATLSLLGATRSRRRGGPR